MLLLAVDTSGKHGSTALADCQPDGSCHGLEVVDLAGGTFSAELVPQIAALLLKHRFSKHQIDAFAVASGPGSFTGLRVGLAAVKALAEVLGKPVATVSVLEAVAMAGHARGRVLAVLDAGRNEVYVGEYEIRETCRLLNERLLSRDEFLDAARQRAVVTPDAVIAAAANGLTVEEIDRPRSDAIARLGWKKILGGQTMAVEDLEANYIRRMDAPIMAKLNG
jgi:tRNA threonylcarbamoyladenosine biosynthesis protein TsaB